MPKDIPLINAYLSNLTAFGVTQFCLQVDVQSLAANNAPAADLTDVDLDAIISQGSFDQDATGSQG